tara:strand:+ start:2438 stop:3313 length:876 start_codon:yes stop_codon:yes gene_type:complete
MTQIAILGAAGMLGSDLVTKLSGKDVTTATRSEVDITNRGQVLDFVPAGAIVINAAAYTQVDLAQSNAEQAFAINAEGVRILSEIVREKDAHLIHLSTDYVFDGLASSPYSEDSSRHPATVYGESKLQGELHVQNILPSSGTILRTAWLYGFHGSSFPKTILTLGKAREQLEVVNDQIGQPTWTHDVADMIVNLISGGTPAGVFHATNSGQTSWFHFAQKLFALAGWDPNRIVPVTSDMYARPAQRPQWSVLGHENWLRHGLTSPRSWESALEEAWGEELHSFTTDTTEGS